MAAAARHDARRSARAIFRERSRGVFVSLAFGLICWMGLQPADCGAGDQSQPIPVVVPARDTVVDFSTEIAPFLRKNCLACHNGRDDEAGVNLETVETIRRGGDNGPVIIPGQGVDSPLLKVAARQRKPQMPPADNKVGAVALTSDQLGLLRLWIDQGANLGSKAHSGTIPRKPLPVTLQPILAMALSPDDDCLAVSRGAHLQVYNLRGPQFEAELFDPELAAKGGTKVADGDLVRSLAFDRSGTMLASGGFRSVRLWTRPRAVFESRYEFGQPARCVAVDETGGMIAIGTETGEIKIRHATGDIGITTLAGKSGAVSALSFTSAGLVSAGADKSVRLWKLPEGTPIAMWTLGFEPRSLGLTPTRDGLAIGGADGVIRLYPLNALVVATDETPTPPVMELKGHTQGVTCIASGADWKDRLVTGGDDGRVKIWDLTTGQVVREMNQEAPVAAVAARHDGSRVASCGARGIRLWNSADGSMVAEFKGDDRVRRDLQRADGAYNYARNNVEYRKYELREAEEALKREMAVVEGAAKTKEMADKTLVEKEAAATKAIEARTAAEKKAQEFADLFQQATDKRVVALKEFTDSEEGLKQAKVALETAREAAAKDKENADLAAAVVTAERNQTGAQQKVQGAQKGLDDATNERNKAQSASQQANQERENARGAARGPEREWNEAKIAAAGAVNFIATSNAILEKAKGVVPTAQQAIQAAEAVVAVRDQEKQRLTALQLELTNKPTPARSVAFSGDGRLLAIASDTGTVQLVDGETGTQLETLSPTPPGVGQPAGRPNSVPTSGPPTIVSFGFVAFSAGAKLHAVGSDGVGVQWRTESSWKFNRVFGGDTDQSPIANRVLSLDFSPDGETLVTAGGVPSVAGELLLWSVREGSLIRQFETGHRDTIQCVRYSPDGQFVATASADRLVKLFRVADGGLVQTFPGHSQPVLALAWRADGRAIVSGGGDQVIKLWNLQTGAAVRTYRGTAYRIGEFRRSITSLAFVGDRDQFVSTSGDKTVRLHRTTNDSDIFAYVGGQSYYHAVAATGDGKWVFAGGQDGVLHAWNAESTYRQHSFTADEPARLKKAN